LANFMVVVFLAAVAAAGIVDALRREPPPAHGLHGTLFYADPQCRVRGVRLPTLATVPAPRARTCDFAVSPAGSQASSWSIWGGAEPLVASCAHDGVEIESPGGPALTFVGGCAPAWGPSGELTFVRHGDVVAFPLHGRARVVLPGEWLRRKLGLDGVAEVVSAAWTGSRGLAVVIRTDDTDDLVALFDGTRPVAGARPGGRLGRVTARADGRALIVGRENGRGVVLLDGRLRVRSRRDVRAAAWSPDGSRLALATAAHVLVFDTATGRRVTEPLRLNAVALAWR
jgi:hypothetical protein